MQVLLKLPACKRVFWKSSFSGREACFNGLCFAENTPKSCVRSGLQTLHFEFAAVSQRCSPTLLCPFLELFLLLGLCVFVCHKL